MPDTQTQLRKGTTAQNNAFTGAVAEVTVDTDKNVAVVHDGVLAGGYPLAGTMFANVFTQTQAIVGGNFSVDGTGKFVVNEILLDATGFTVGDVSLTNPTFLGMDGSVVAADGDFSVSTIGDVSANKLLLPNTASAAVGGIYFGGNRAFHNFGASNIFAGVNAGNLTMTGDQNSFFGVSSGIVNSTGLRNSFFGESAGRSNTIGNYNSFFGQFAGYFNISGNSNAFFGREAGFYNSTGSGNSFFGAQAGYTNSAGIDNCFFGANAGYYSYGNNNILIGARAADNLSTGSNNIFIGFDINTPLNTASNLMSIGNLIFGTGIDGTGTTVSTGKIGIAVVTPTSGLHLGRSFATPYRAVAGTDTFTADDYTINATSGTFTVNLPTAVGITGRIYVAKNSGVGTITLDPAGAELIDGSATATIVAGAALMVQSTGAGWIII